MASSKVEEKEKLDAIRKVLLEQWDPLGVRDEVMARDEYDSYLQKIIALLSKHASLEEIERYLGDIVSLDMGLVDVASRDRAAAISLIKLAI